MNYGIADYIVVGVVCGSVIWFIATGLITTGHAPARSEAEGQ